MDELFHENQYDYKCGHCQENFSMIDDLKSHLISMHSKVKNETLEKQTLDNLKPIPEKDTSRKTVKDRQSYLKKKIISRSECDLCEMKFYNSKVLKETQINCS